MSEHNFLSMRRAMVESQLRTTDVSDPKVVAAMATVPREKFVPADMAALAYIDRSISITPDRAISPPLATGLMLTVAEISKEDNVLIVGVATGYTAAVASELAGSVTALEADADLAKQAKANLSAIDNVTLVSGDLAAGHKKNAPYSLIVVDGAVEQLPESLVKQLTDGGRLVAAINENGVTRLGIGRRAGGAFGLSFFADSEAAALPGFEKSKEFSF